MSNDPVGQMSVAAIEQRLANMSEGLAADGYDLRVRLEDDNGVTLTVAATDDACEDCLVPKHVFRDIMAAELGGMVEAGDLRIEYPNDLDDGAGAAPQDSTSYVSDSSPTAWDSQLHDVAGWDEAQALARANKWTDGLPIIPPTEDRVRAMLGSVSLEPGAVVGEASERNVVITAEAVAINAVMAGLEPELMPILVAALEAVCDPEFKFNHLASIGSPWPIFLVTGPVADRLALNSGLYVFGPESPANAQLSRALSFVLRNRAHAVNGGIQRGQWGNPIRWQSFIAEDPQSPWGPMHTDLGFDPDTSVVTAVSLEPGAPYQVKLGDPDPKAMMAALCDATAEWGAALSCRGTYVILIGPHQARWLHDQGWSRSDVREYILDNTSTSVANLKRRKAWGHVDDVPEGMWEITQDDEDTQVYLFRKNEEVDRYMWIQSAMESRELNVRIVVSGGDAGRRFSVGIPYEFSTNPVSKEVR